MGKIVHRHNQPGLNRYPFKNRSLTDMPGEKWKPVEGMDELFWISDKGRIKALPRLIQRKIKDTIGQN